MKSEGKVSRRVVSLALAAVLTGGITFAQETAPSGYAAEMDKANVAKGNDRYDEAATSFEKANQLAGGNNGPALVALTDMYNRAGKHDQALRTGHQAVQAAGTPALKAAAFSQIGVALVKTANGDKQRLGAAEQVFRKSLEAQKNDTVRLNLAAVLRQLGRAQDADAQVAEIEKGNTHPLVDLDLGVAGKYEAATRTSGPNPGVPMEAAKSGVSGKLTLKVTVDKEGNAADVAVVRGLPHGVSEAGVAALKQWKFKPATLDGKPVATYFEVSFVFQRPHG